MHPAIHILSLMSIIGLTLGGLTGCGERRLHVATVSGFPGQEVALEPIDEDLQAKDSGLVNESVDESILSSQIPDGETVSTEPVESAMTNEPINMAHESTAVPIEDGSSDSSLVNPINSGFSSNDSSITPLGEGQDFLAQSSSSPEDPSNPLSNIEDFQEPPSGQDFSAGLQDTLSGEGIEPLPNEFKIAKAEPSDSLEDQMNRMQEEELAASAAGLEDVFFQFDSWTLTEEGKQTLERTLGWFEQDPSANLIIEGHADQRGTQAYNMVLAKKRAAAIQDYLSQLGVSPSRLAVISYGKDKPFCQDATEVCYQLNRRGHLLVPNP
jgi:outer membrane protein OmpA-like peptidoglycan-associated protein